MNKNQKGGIAATTMVFALCVSACSPETTEQGGATATPQAEEATAPAPARTVSPEGARVFFITPTDGDTVSNPIRIEFGLAGMEVAKAGEDRPDSGHHHLLVDTELPDLGAAIPADANHIHFGDGSTSTEITLEPGRHTLCLLLGDHLHVPHDPPIVSEPITITVE